MKFFFPILILFLKLRKIILLPANEFLENANKYSNELCSYNGVPKYNSTLNEVDCECKEKYADEPRKDKIKYINGHMIHCSYERKSRFTAIFLALCLPFGFDFLYLNRYIIFVIVFIVTIIMIACNIILFILNYKINLKTKETIIQSKLNKMTNKVRDPKINEDNKGIKLLNIFTKLITFNHLIYMTVDLILHIIGKIPDANNVDTESDFKYLFESPD